MVMIHHRIDEAIREAQALATSEGLPQGIAWVPSISGWQIYSLLVGTLDEPEFVCLGQGRVPIPVTDTAEQVWHSLLRARGQL